MDSNDAECSAYFVAFDLIIGNVPMVLFLIASYINYR